MPAYYTPYSKHPDLESSGLVDTFFNYYGQYIKEIEVNDNSAWYQPTITITFSQWRLNSPEEQYVRDANRLWREINKRIADGTLSMSKVMYSAQKFMDNRNASSTTAQPDGYQIKFDKEESFPFALDKAMHAPSNAQWLKLVNDILGKENKKEKEMNPKATIMNIEKVVFNGPATIIFWRDKTKTIVKCMEGDTYDPEKAVLLACLEHSMGGKGPAKKWLKKMTEGAPKNCPNIIDSKEVAELRPLIGMSREEEQAEFEKIKLQFRHRRLVEYVRIHATIQSCTERAFLELMARVTKYTYKTVLEWYEGSKPISDTAWKKLIREYSGILEVQHA